MVIFSEEIDDAVFAEKRHRAEIDAANEANEAKTEFVSKVSHDIRTPMNSLFGFLQIAEANIEDTKQVEYCLKKIRVAGEFLKELVNDVLDISKMENNKMTLKEKEISVTTLFEELPTSMEGADFGKKISFNFNIHDIFCDKVMGDALRLKQIYTNILSNAVKYTPEGGKIDFEVFETEMKSSEKVKLTVKISDTGIGMSHEFMGKMFSKFERETDTRLNSVSGYGLGLSIVKQLVDAMGGKIDVQSEIGKGTTFIVELVLVPAKIEDAAADIMDNSKEKCKGMHLLVAEDNELNCEVINELIVMNGMSCDMAHDGVECVEMLKKHQNYDAVLMDMQMPNMSGIEATKLIRGLDIPARNVPIIAMTANALKIDVEKCIDAGMSAHIAKPIDVNELLKTLADIR